MLQYLVILLDDSSVSFCHYENTRGARRLIGIEDLKRGIRFAMKENLNIQFVYPDYALPQEYEDVIESIDHTKIKPAACGTDADVAVVDGCGALEGMALRKGVVYVVRTDRAGLFGGHAAVSGALARADRLNVVITDADRFTEEDFGEYRKVLAALSDSLEKLYAAGKSPQLNILTDRMMLESMNNCGAGDSTITLAPDGRFYVCPAFYYMPEADGSEKSLAEVCRKGFSIGDVQSGPDIGNLRLYKLGHAPLCRTCDAYQCKRCVWMNRRVTCEVNTPGREQCVAAHLERNASRGLLERIRRHGSFLPGREIEEITYLDPFDVRELW